MVGAEMANVVHDERLDWLNRAIRESKNFAEFGATIGQAQGAGCFRPLTQTNRAARIFFRTRGDLIWRCARGFGRRLEARRSMRSSFGAPNFRALQSRVSAPMTILF